MKNATTMLIWTLAMEGTEMAHENMEFKMRKFQKLSNSFGMEKDVPAQLLAKVIIYGWS